MSQCSRVYVRDHVFGFLPGTYFLGSVGTLKFGASDSGTEAAPVTWTAYNNEKVSHTSLRSSIDACEKKMQHYVCGFACRGVLWCEG